jgi:hypothetical protein
MMQRILVWVFSVVSCCLAADVALAQATAAQAPVAASTPAAGAAERGNSAKAPEPEAWGRSRLLGGHRFPLAVFVATALPISYMGVRAGLEYHEVPGYAQLPALGTGSSSQPVDLQTINVAETLDFAVQLHDYVALFGDAYGRARVGANTSTLLGTGADYTYGGELGALAKIVRFGGFQLAVRAQLGLYAGQTAGVLGLFEDLNRIASNAITQVQANPTINLNTALNSLNTAFRSATADLLTPFSGVNYGASLNMAQALGRFVGLQGSFGFTIDTTTYDATMLDVGSGAPVVTQSKLHSTRPHAALALDVDLDPVQVPLDFMLEYRVSPVTVTRSSDVSSLQESAVEQLFALGVYYSGRSDLQLGVTGYVLFGQIPQLGANAQPSGKPLDLGTQFVFRYFW